MTNREFMHGCIFQKTCELTRTQPTKRQASKYRSGKGKAFTAKLKATNLCSNKEN